MSKHLVICITLTILLIRPLWAEDLDAIQVTGTKDASQFHLGSSQRVSTVESRPSVPTINPLLESIPGLVSSQNGGLGGRVSYFIRGTESRHIAFTLDGLKLNDPSNIDRQFDSAFFTSPILSEATVFKGPQSVLFGSDAMGGLVSMRTRRGENAPETRLNLTAGSFGTYSSFLARDWKTQNHNGTLTAGKIISSGFSRLNKKRFNAKEKDSADITNTTSSSEHRWKERWQTDLLFSYTHGKSELDGNSDDNSHDHSVSDQYLAQQKTSYALDKKTALSLRNGLNRHQRYSNQLSLGKSTFQGRILQNEFLFQKEISHYSVSSGISTEHEDLESQSLSRSFDLHSFFLQNLYKKDDWSIQGGVRAENHTRYGNFTTGSTGLSYLPGIHTFSLQYSQGFKAPGLYQLYAPAPLGNKELVPERNHSWEAGWTSKNNSWETGLSFFQNNLSNLITYSSNGYRNQGNFIAEGVELSGKYAFSKFLVSSGFTHQQFREVETVVLRRPYNMANLNFSYFMTEASELFTKLRWFDSRKDLGPVHNEKLNGFETVDLGARYVKNRDEYGIQLTNLFNREYEELYGYTVMPRSLFLNYGRKF